MIWFRVTITYSGGQYVTRNLNNTPIRALHAVIDELQRRIPGLLVLSTNVVPDP